MMATRTWFIPGVGIIVEKDAGRTWFVPGGGTFEDVTSGAGTGQWLPLIGVGQWLMLALSKLGLANGWN